MLPGPDYLYRCPRCSALARQSSISSGNTFGAVYWSDAKREAPMLPERPALVACPKCETCLWIESLELVGEFEWYRPHTPLAAAETPAEWAEAPYLRRPDGDDFERALSAGLGDTPERERYIRIRLWWSLNDTYRKDDALHNSKDTVFLGNLERLALLLDDGTNDTLLRAEIARESGRFEQAVQLCDKLVSVNAEKHLAETTALIRARAMAKDVRVFRL
jgi:hypothetical protein